MLEAVRGARPRFIFPPFFHFFSFWIPLFVPLFFISNHPSSPLLDFMCLSLPRATRNGPAIGYSEIRSTSRPGFFPLDHHIRSSVLDWMKEIHRSPPLG